MAKKKNKDQFPVDVSRQECQGIPLSIVVAVHNMPEQAGRTLHSLSPTYQEDVEEGDYEVIVVENRSNNNLSSETLKSMPANFSYHLRVETEPSPVHAINFGGSLAQGNNICCMIDGARMVTPGVVKNLLNASKMNPDAVVTVPGYHLGHRLQQYAADFGYGEGQEKQLLRKISWPECGYKLFEISCFSGSCQSGIFLPNSESNCISVPRWLWFKLGGYDRRFSLPGGGLINLDFYKRACEFPECQHIVLMGEGTFHQFHGGVTTGGISKVAREVLLEQFEAQYVAIRGAHYQCPVTEPLFIGTVRPETQRFIEQSISMLAENRKSSLIGTRSNVRAIDG